MQFSALRRRLLPVVIEILVNVVLPLMIYDRVAPLKGDFWGLIASSVPPVLWSLGEFLWQRRIDALSLLVLLGIALSLLAMLGGGSARMLQLREHLVTALIGLIFLGSAAIRRPLIYQLARAQMHRQANGEALAAFDGMRERPAFKRTMMVMTVVWGLGLLLSAALACLLILWLSVHDTLIALPILSYTTMGALSLWTVLYVRRARRRGARQGLPAVGASAE